MSRDLGLGDYVVGIVGAGAVLVASRSHVSGHLLRFLYAGLIVDRFRCDDSDCVATGGGRRGSYATHAGSPHVRGGGDFASPRSDTSIISSMSAACDHVDHINTQMPYALLVAGVAFVGYIIAVLLV